MTEYSRRNLGNIVSGKCNDDCPIDPDRLTPWPVKIVDCKHFEKDGYQCKLKKRGMVVSEMCDDDCPLYPDHLIPWPDIAVRCKYFDGGKCQKKKGMGRERGSTYPSCDKAAESH